MSVNKYLEAFAQPFDVSKVKWRLQSTNDNKTEGYAVPYLDSRTIGQRLDDVVGQMRWKDEYKPWMNTQEGPSQLCIIYIYDDDLKEWIGKSDGAGISKKEPVKGGISDAFKRAAVKWGIGRYLYSMEPVWVKAKPKGKSAVIDKDEMPKLQQRYIIFLKNLKNGNAPETQADKAKPTSEPKNSQQTQQPKITPLYEILGVKKQKDGQNVRSMLKIKDIKGGNKTATVYYNGTDDNFKEGAKLNNAVFYSKETGFGKVHILQDYELAA